MMNELADLILMNGHITTLTGFAASQANASALAIRNERFIAVGETAEVMRWRGPNTSVIDLEGRRVVPGLIDSHTHVIRGGLNYNMELRWDGLPSLALALRSLRKEVARTPAPQWVRVIGGFSEFQFVEKRLPTLDELNSIGGDTPIFVLHLYDRALLNGAALRALGYTKDTPDPPAGRIERDRHGNPTGLLIAKPNAMLLYSALARGPKLGPGDQRNSTRRFMRELNRLGLTSVVDAGGGYQNYPDDYQVIEELARSGELSLRIAYNLFTQQPKHELDDFRRWSRVIAPGAGDAMLRFNGAGEMLVFSAADFEDFREPRPDLPATMETELEAVVEHLVAQGWPFRLHATYDESIGRFLDTFERVNRKIPLAGTRWWFDHAETVSAKNIERIAQLGGGVAIQHRMAFQGEYFVERYGRQTARHSPPLRALINSGIALGGGTDATRVATYNPWIGLQWLVTGETVGGTELYSPEDRLSREEALRLYTASNAWFSGEQGQKGQIAVGYLADLAVLSHDYFFVPPQRIRDIESELTLLGGKVVWASQAFGRFAPPALPVSPGWSPVAGSEGSAGVAAHPSAGEPALGSCGCSF
jgi:predicted amidohydrolase YtcJ